MAGGPIGGVSCSNVPLRRIAVNGTSPPVTWNASVSQLLFPGNVSVVPWNSKRLTRPNGYVWLAAVNQVRPTPRLYVCPVLHGGGLTRALAPRRTVSILTRT